MKITKIMFKGIPVKIVKIGSHSKPATLKEIAKVQRKLAKL